VFGRRQQSAQEGAPVQPDKFEAIIGPTVTIKGTLISQGNVRIDGVVEGDVEAKGSVIVGEGAKVVANITGHNVSVAGTVKGNIAAAGRLEITSKGRVWGDTVAATLAVDEGGVLSGRCQLRDAELPPELSEGAAGAKKG